MREIREQFAAALQVLMRHRGLNQRVLARRSGISQSLISRYLRGDEKAMTPTLDSLVKLAGALDCTLDELTGFRRPVASRAEDPVAGEIEACTAALRRLPEDHWLRVFVRQELL